MKKLRWYFHISWGGEFLWIGPFLFEWGQRYPDEPKKFRFDICSPPDRVTTYRITVDEESGYRVTVVKE